MDESGRGVQTSSYTFHRDCHHTSCCNAISRDETAQPDLRARRTATTDGKTRTRRSAKHRAARTRSTRLKWQTGEFSESETHAIFLSSWKRKNVQKSYDR